MRIDDRPVVRARKAPGALAVLGRSAVVMLACAAVLVLAREARAESLGCGLPDAQPLWIDFADGSVDFREAVFGRPGIVAATRGVEPAEGLRRLGTQTVYWHMLLKEIVGNLKSPHSTAEVREQTRLLIKNARTTTGCRTPIIALNELFGASIPTPWPPKVARYRANVLLAMELLSASGARPFLLVHGRAEGRRAPSTAGAAAGWWRAVAAEGFIVRQMHFDGPLHFELGAVAGSRTRRIAMRQALSAFTRLGIPAQRLGLLLGFQSGLGKGGREGLATPAWLEIVKRETLAARHVAAQFGIGTVWSWGWGTFDAAGADPDKPTTACVHLWTRDPNLCDAPAVAGPALDPSLTDGQIILPAGAYCVSELGQISRADANALTPVLGSRTKAISALLMALVAEHHSQGLSWRDVRRTEKAIVAARFAGDWNAYATELRGLGISQTLARSILTTSLRRATIRVQATLHDPLGRRRLSLRHRYRDARQTVVCANDTIPSFRLFSWANQAPLLDLPAGPLTIAASEHPKHKARTRLSGHTTDARGTVTVYASPTENGPYTEIATTTADRDGTWRLTVRPETRTTYRATSLTATSAPIAVHPPPTAAKRKPVVAGP